MIYEGIYDCTFCGNETAMPFEVSTVPKQEYVNECPKCSNADLVHVKVERNGDVRVWVRGHSHNNQKVLSPHVRR